MFSSAKGKVTVLGVHALFNVRADPPYCSVVGSATLVDSIVFGAMFSRACALRLCVNRLKLY